MSGEADIIQRVLAPLAAGYAGAFGLTDDAAVMAPPGGYELVATMDAVAEGVHFFGGDKAGDIGWKALAVNVSDLVAKGATPHVYLMSLAFPREPARDWLGGFAAGLGEAQTAFGITLIGGDTDRRPGPVSVTISAFGIVPVGAMVRRGAARVGDRVFVSGTLGDAALGLKLRGGASEAAAWGLSEAERSHLVGRYLRPQPRVALAGVLRAHAHASMDISDGLLKDLGRMCAASGVGAVIELGALPVSQAAAAVVARAPGEMAAIVGGGDDYEVLAAMSAREAGGYVAAARAAGVAVREIGRIVAGAGVALVGRDGTPVEFERDGWDHF